MAQKAAFDILARCFYNNGIKDLVQIMIQIFEQDTSLASNFLRAIMDNSNGEAMLEVLLDCTDSTARSTIGDLFRYLITMVKMSEKEALMSAEYSNTVSAKFLGLITAELGQRVAKNWSRFEKYLELFTAFAFYSPEQVSAQIQASSSKVDQWSPSDPAAQLGLETFFKLNMLERLLDFILQDKSPLFVDG